MAPPNTGGTRPSQVGSRQHISTIWKRDVQAEVSQGIDYSTKPSFAQAPINTPEAISDGAVYLIVVPFK